MTTRLKDTRGFALAIAMFALILLAAIVAGGYFSATQEFQIGRSMRSMTSSFYSGETAVREVIASWDPSVYATLAIGDTIRIGPTTLPGGGEYSVTVERVGAPPDSVKRYFYIEATGRPGQGARGERRQAAMVSAWFPDLCCDATVKVEENISLSGPSRIFGENMDPPGTWPAAACMFAGRDSVYGAAISSSSNINRPGNVSGVPAGSYVEPGLDESNMFTFGDYAFNDLVSRADHVFTSDFTMNDTQPTLDASGACDRTNPLNWGEPDDASHPCFDFFPVVHAHYDLELQGAGRAQGILLVEDDLILSGPFEFYGIALVGGDLISTGQVDFHGGAIVADSIGIGGNASLMMSQCAVWRAERFSSLSRPQLLSPRAWVEMF